MCIGWVNTACVFCRASLLIIMSSVHSYLTITIGSWMKIFNSNQFGTPMTKGFKRRPSFPFYAYPVLRKMLLGISWKQIVHDTKVGMTIRILPITLKCTQTMACIWEQRYLVVKLLNWAIYRESTKSVIFRFRPKNQGLLLIFSRLCLSVGFMQ